MLNDSTNPQAWQASLPKKCVAAGALFLDQQGRLLIVKPTYKPLWNIPGDIVEADESPRQGCRREVKEEIGLDKSLERLLCVEYSAGTDSDVEKLLFVFWGGVLTAEEIATIRLPAEELSDHCFLPVDEALALLPPAKATRVCRSLQVVEKGGAFYRESGQDE